MPEKIAIGFGCFWFGIKGGRPPDFDWETFNPNEHIQKAKLALSRIANITDIRFRGDNNLSFGFGGPVSISSDQDYSFFPAYAFVSVYFGIYLPKRLQNDIANYPEDTDVDTENFNVLISYEPGEAPIAAIYYETENETPDPSRAVVFIRKYLEKEFKDDYVAFCSLGPSPFHADLTLEKYDTLAGPHHTGFTIHDLSESDGYKRYTVISREHSENKQDMLLGFLQYVGPFLSSYYSLIRDRVILMELSDAARNNLDRLLDIERTKGFRRFFDHLIKSPRIISGVLASMLEIKVAELRTSQFLSERKREQKLLEETPFYAFIEEAQTDKEIFPASEVREVIRLFEGRHLRLSENLAVLIAGLLGGIVGALLTWAIQPGRMW